MRPPDACLIVPLSISITNWHQIIRNPKGHITPNMHCLWFCHAPCSHHFSSCFSTCQWRGFCCLCCLDLFSPHDPSISSGRQISMEVKRGCDWHRADQSTRCRSGSKHLKTNSNKKYQKIFLLMVYMVSFSDRGWMDWTSECKFHLSTFISIDSLPSVWVRFDLRLRLRLAIWAFIAS